MAALWSLFMQRLKERKRLFIVPLLIVLTIVMVLLLLGRIPGNGPGPYLLL